MQALHTFRNKRENRLRSSIDPNHLASMKDRMGRPDFACLDFCLHAGKSDWIEKLKSKIVIDVHKCPIYQGISRYFIALEKTITKVSHG